MNHFPATIVVLSLLSSNAFSEVQINEKTTHYPVEPTGIHDMYKIFMSSSPIRKNGQTYLGTTAWKVWWEWGWKFKNNRCRLKSVNAFVEIEYLLPKLVPKHYEADILFTWDKWYPRLERHEKNHAKYAIETAELGVQEILKIPSERKCEQVHAAAEQLSSDLIKQLRTKNKMYDYRTIHGRTEGADLNEYF